MIMVKLRTFGFLAVALAGLFFSSCAVTPRRAAVSGLAPALQPNWESRRISSPRELRASLASADAADIYHYSFDRQYVS